jgi:hypothetical protein
MFGYSIIVLNFSHFIYYEMPNDSIKKIFTSSLIVFIWGFYSHFGKVLTTRKLLPLVWFRMTLAVLFILLSLSKPIRISKKKLFYSFTAGRFYNCNALVYLFKAIGNVPVTLVSLQPELFFHLFIRTHFYKRKIVLRSAFRLIVILGLSLILEWQPPLSRNYFLALTCFFIGTFFCYQ